MSWEQKTFRGNGFMPTSQTLRKTMGGNENELRGKMARLLALVMAISSAIWETRCC